MKGKHLSKQTRRRIRQAAAIVLSSAVIFTTVYALILEAITVDDSNAVPGLYLDTEDTVETTELAADQETEGTDNPAEGSGSESALPVSEDTEATDGENPDPQTADTSGDYEDTQVAMDGDLAAPVETVSDIVEADPENTEEAGEEVADQAEPEEEISEPVAEDQPIISADDDNEEENGLTEDAEAASDAETEEPAVEEDVCQHPQCEAGDPRVRAGPGDGRCHAGHGGSRRL